MEKSKIDQKGKILIVDDDPHIVKSVYHYLVLEGFNPISALSGKEALQKIRIENPDLIILDLMMPELDGFQVMEILKKDKETCNIPIIILTAKTANEDLLRGWREGAAHYITKPFELEELVHAIQLVMEDKRKQSREEKKIYEI